MALKKIALLAVALSCLLGMHLLSGASGPTPRTSKSKTGPSSARRSVNTSTPTVRHSRRRRRRWNPWRVSSFGNPGADDKSAGEDPLVRAAALSALGQWNGGLVVVEPTTGRILSIVNQKLALSSAFTPCSTFKPIVALGALKEGIISPWTELHVGRRTEMNLIEALARSNNPFFAKVGEMLGFERVSRYASDFGLGQKVGWNIFGETSGMFPSQPPRQGGVGLMTSSGQDIQVSMLQMAAVASAIANGGTFYYLQYPRSPEELANFQPIVRRRLEGYDRYFLYLKQGLAAAVIYGTARQAYDPEEQIFGKTGTCSEDGARLGWFVSYADQQQPKYVVVVLLRGGRLMYGPHAAEIAGRFYRDLRQRGQTPAGASQASSALNLPGY